MIQSNYNEQNNFNYSDNDQQDLEQIFNSIKRRSNLFIFISSSIFSFSILFLLVSRIFFPVYKGSLTILIEDPLAKDVSNGSSQKNNQQNDFLSSVAINSSSKQDIPTLIELLGSPALLSPIEKSLKLPPEYISKRLSIKAGGGKTRLDMAKGVLKINLEDRNPVSGQKLLEKIGDTYLQTALDQKQKRLRDGLKFLDSQYPKILKKNSDLQDQLVELRRENFFLEPKSQIENISALINEVENNLIELELQENRLNKTKEKILNGDLSIEGFTEIIASGITREGVRPLGLKVENIGNKNLKTLKLAEQDLANKKMIFKPKSKTIQDLEKKIILLRKNTINNQLDAVDSAIDTNKKQLLTTKEQKMKFQNLFADQPELFRKYENLRLKIAVSNKNLNALITSRENYEFQIAQEKSPWKIISPASFSDIPIKPNLINSIFVSFLLSIFGGFITSIIRDRFDNFYYENNDIKNDFNNPILANILPINFSQGENKEIFNKNNQLTFSQSDQIIEEFGNYKDSFRSLYSSIKFLQKERPFKTLFITSSISGEGKTLINILLAKTISEMGSKVLLVDANFKNPAVHSYLGIKNDLGLSDILVSKDLDWQKKVKKIKAIGMLDVITSGSSKQDPISFLNSKNMDKLFEDFKKSNYEIILVDTSSILKSSDTLSISQYCDAGILLVSISNVKRNSAIMAREKLKFSETSFIGIISNMINNYEKAYSKDILLNAFGSIKNYFKSVILKYK